jgi:hypothetical protein
LPEVLIFGQQDTLFAPGIVDDGLIVCPAHDARHGNHVVAGCLQRPNNDEIATLVGNELHGDL